jgi:hypothetical protein
MNYLSDAGDILVVMLVDHVWQLAFLLPVLLVLKQVKDDVRPIFVGMVGPLAKQAQSNALSWSVGIMLGVLSSLGALTEVATQMHWVYVAIGCKVLGPGLATIVALVKQSPATPPTPVATPQSSGTNPPMPLSSQL